MWFYGYYDKKYFFYGYYDNEYFKNNIKIIILLKRAQIKNNFETTKTIVYDCGFKKNCKTTFCTVVLRIFLKLLKPQLPMMIFYT